MTVDGKALSAVGIGALFLWSGIKGWSVLGTLQDIVAGKPPNQIDVYPLTNQLEKSVKILPGGTDEVPTSGGIAGTALQYVGHPYKFGGAPGRNAEKPWDCSSFVNYIVGVKFGRAIPGVGPGKYTGMTHGPPSASWAIWPGLARIKRSEVAAGDIIVWTGHVGIAIDNARMVSALNPKDTTKVTTIDGFRSSKGPLLVYGRLR